MPGARRRRVGLLGGSFDPPHAGHLWMARRAHALWSLDEVWLVPAHHPPHKDADRQTPFAQRAALARVLVESSGEDWLRVDAIEAERPGPSYSLDTVRALKARHGATQRFALILGADSLADLDGWHEPAQLCAEVELLVLAREGSPTPARWPHRLAAGETHPAQSRVIRGCLAAGRETPWLPAAVAAAARRAGLYRKEAP